MVFLHLLFCLFSFFWFSLVDFRKFEIKIYGGRYLKLLPTIEIYGGKYLKLLPAIKIAWNFVR